MTSRSAVRTLLLALALVSVAAPRAQNSRPPLTSSDIDDIATLLKLEDTRTFDGEALGRLAHAKHPEVQRRAMMSLGRIVSDGSRALVAQLRAEFAPTTNTGTVLAFASGQLKDPDAVAWLADALKSGSMETQTAAARALGEIRSPEARTALSDYLTAASVSASNHPGIGEALLSLGRFTSKGADLTPITRFVPSPDPEIRWRVAWALFRPRDPAALPYLLTLIADKSPEVRFWAVRGLAPAVIDQAGGDRAKISAQVRSLVHDPDRRVQTEALRALLQFDDEGAFAELLAALKSPDTWLSTSAAENAARFAASHADALRPALVAASTTDKPLWLRQVVLTPLSTLAPEAAVEVAASMAREDVAGARTSAVQALGRLGDAGKARYEELSKDPAIKTPLPPLPTPRPTPTTAPAAGGGAAAASGAGTAGGAAGGGNRGGGGGRPPIQPRSDAEYRRIVETWIVPDYNGQPKPRAIWETKRGSIELELYPGDAPLGTEYFMKSIESGDIVGTEFSRVVPNFVDQQATIRNAPNLRDEVNLRGLTRANLAWASSGLDTGRPGYTLGNTPQPHNEGDFTSLGRVVSGLDVMDHIEWGDKILSARIKK